MCAIIGSFSKDKLYELYQLNSYRGALSYSLAAFKIKNNNEVEFNNIDMGRGELSKELVDKTSDGLFYVAHSQAPTTQATNIHPAMYGHAMLWHNGIIKQKSLPVGSWDTAWLLENIINYGWSSLSRVDGTFACVLYNANELFVFRNEISPLFLDNNLNISSTKFENSFSIDPNIVFKIDLFNNKIQKVAFFDTFENPYYIPE